MKHCKVCKHEMTEAGKESLAEGYGICFGCQPRVTRCSGKCTQETHDIEAVEGGMMTLEKFYDRNPKSNVKFEEVVNQ